LWWLLTPRLTGDYSYPAAWQRLMQNAKEMVLILRHNYGIILIYAE